MKTFRGSAWVAYDRLYRRHASSQHSLNWATEDLALYNEAFVGQAKIILRCGNCLSENHTTEVCPEFVGIHAWPPHPWPNHGYHPYPPPPMPPPPTPQGPDEICLKFNDNICMYPACKRRHVCVKCGHPHPAVLCGSTGSAGSRGRDRPHWGPPRSFPRRPPQKQIWGACSAAL